MPPCGASWKLSTLRPSPKCRSRLSPRDVMYKPTGFVEMPWRLPINLLPPGGESLCVQWIVEIKLWIQTTSCLAGLPLSGKGKTQPIGLGCIAWSRSHTRKIGRVAAGRAWKRCRKPYAWPAEDKRSWIVWNRVKSTSCRPTSKWKGSKAKEL